MVPQAAARGRLRTDASAEPTDAAAYHPGHAARDRHRQHERHDRAVPERRRWSRRVARRRAPRATADELELLLEGLLRLDDAAFADVSAIVVRLGRARRDRARRDDRRAPRAAAHCSLAPGPCRSRSASDRPGEVGADRLVNALAAARLYGTPAVVVDLGTATTFDCVAADGAFVGGAIAPGLELGLEALAARTAKLPRVELRAPDRAIGRDTVSAIQSRRGPRLPGARRPGCSRGSVASSPTQAGVGRRRRPRDPDRRPVGGAVGARLEGVEAIDPDLTLKGLAILHAEVGGRRAAGARALP